MKNFTIFTFLSLNLLVFSGLNAQGTAYTLKGGLTLGVQQWNSFDQDPLFKYHGAISAESLDESAQFSIYAQAGYHLKGSALRNQQFFNINNPNQPFRLPAQEFIFRNISVVLGAKRKYELSDRLMAYYLIGLRGDYTLSTNLKEYKALNEANNTLFYPADEYVRKWNYGVALGGGFEFSLGELVGANLEFTVNPDFSQQYRQPQINNVYNPFTRQNGNIPERIVRNVTFEISAGFRLLRIVEYVD
jgi:hypothetical protein